MSRPPFAGARTLVLAAAVVFSQAVLAGELTPVSKVAPEFPREAHLARVDKGYVKARLTIDAKGEVTSVDILEARPRRVFDRAVIRTLSQWRYEPGSGERSAEVELDFKVQ